MITNDNFKKNKKDKPPSYNECVDTSLLPKYEQAVKISKNQAPSTKIIGRKAININPSFSRLNDHENSPNLISENDPDVRKDDSFMNEKEATDFFNLLLFSYVFIANVIFLALGILSAILGSFLLCSSLLALLYQLLSLIKTKFTRIISFKRFLKYFVLNICLMIQTIFFIAKVQCLENH